MDAAGHVIRVDYPHNDWVQKQYTGNLASKLMDAAGNTTEYFYCHEQLTGVRLHSLGKVLQLHAARGAHGVRQPVFCVS